MDDFKLPHTEFVKKVFEAAPEATINMNKKQLEDKALTIFQNELALKR